VEEEEEEEDVVQTSFYPICTISTTLDRNFFDEDTFISNFLQNQYPTDVRINDINNEDEYEKYADKKGELWEKLFTSETYNPTVKTVEIIP